MSRVEVLKLCQLQKCGPVVSRNVVLKYSTVILVVGVVSRPRARGVK